MVKKRKSILIVTRNLPPLIGGMERLNWHIADELSKRYQVSLLSHKEAQSQAPKDVAFYAAPLKPLPLFLLMAFIKTFYLCLKKQPDILLAGSGLTAPIVVFWAKLFRKKSIVYIHGLDISNASKVYQSVWLPFIRAADVVIANSTPTRQLCLQNNLKEEKIHIIHPGVSYPAKAPDVELIQQLKTQYGLENKNVLLSVGRLTERKGLNEFINKSFVDIVRQRPNTVLVVVGDTASESLNRKSQTIELILTTAKKHQLTENIVFTGNISEAALSNIYYLADIHVFPVKHIPEDPEGFGMVAIEAAAHGTPTIAFATGGIVDAVQNGQSGYLIANQQYADLTEKILTLLENNTLIKEENCKQFAEQFAWHHLAEKFSQRM